MCNLYIGPCTLEVAYKFLFCFLPARSFSFFYTFYIVAFGLWSFFSFFLRPSADHYNVARRIYLCVFFKKNIMVNRCLIARLPLLITIVIRKFGKCSLSSRVLTVLLNGISISACAASALLSTFFFY